MIVMDQKQKKTNMKLVWKFFNKQKKLNYNIHFIYYKLLVDTITKTLQQSVYKFWLAQSYHPDYTQDLWYFWKENLILMVLQLLFLMNESQPRWSMAISQHS